MSFYNHKFDDSGLINITIFGAGNLGLSLLALMCHKIPHTRLRIAIIDKNKELLDKIGKEDLIGDSRVHSILKKYKENINKNTELGSPNYNEEREYIFICVPSGDAILDCVNQIRKNISHANVIICSTLFIGEFDKLMKDANISSYDEHKFFYMPVFLRAGSGFDDLNSMDRIILGIAGSSAHSRVVQELIFDVFPVNPSKFFMARYKEAEVLKVAHNAFVAAKIVFSNEIGRLCDNHEINKHNVMKMFAADDRAISSDRHLNAGQPYTGPCLTKDTIKLLKHINKISKENQNNFTLLGSIHDSNILHILDIFYQILDLPRPVCIIGLGYKDGFNDLRESLGTQLMHLIENEETILDKREFAFVDKYIKGQEDLLKFCRYNHHLYELISKYIPISDDYSQYRSFVLINNVEDSLREELNILSNSVNILDLSNNF